MKNQQEEVVLSGCYHTGLTYSLGYYVHGEVELVGETFTNLNTGLDGGAMASLLEHRQQFDPMRDIEQFIVELKPVKIIPGREEGEDYKLDEDLCDTCLEEIDDCIREDDYDWCPACGELKDECICDEFDQEFIVDTFHPMNAFDRVRWLKAEGKI